MNDYNNILAGDAAGAWKRLVGRFYWLNDSEITKHLIEVHDQWCGDQCSLEKSCDQQKSGSERSYDRPDVIPSTQSNEEKKTTSLFTDVISSTQFNEENTNISLQLEVDEGAESVDDDSSNDGYHDPASEEEDDIKQEPEFMDCTPQNGDYTYQKGNNLFPLSTSEWTDSGGDHLSQATPVVKQEPTDNVEYGNSVIQSVETTQTKTVSYDHTQLTSSGALSRPVMSDTNVGVEKQESVDSGKYENLERTVSHHHSPLATLGVPASLSAVSTNIAKPSVIQGTLSTKTSIVNTLGMGPQSVFPSIPATVAQTLCPAAVNPAVPSSGAPASFSVMSTRLVTSVIPSVTKGISSTKTSTVNPLGTGPHSVLNPLGTGPQSVLNPLGVRPQSVLNPLGAGPQSVLNPLGVGPQSVLNPLGNSQFSFIPAINVAQTPAVLNPAVIGAHTLLPATPGATQTINLATSGNVVSPQVLNVVRRGNSLFLENAAAPTPNLQNPSFTLTRPVGRNLQSASSVSPTVPIAAKFVSRRKLVPVSVSSSSGKQVSTASKSHSGADEGCKQIDEKNEKRVDNAQTAGEVSSKIGCVKRKLSQTEEGPGTSKIFAIESGGNERTVKENQSIDTVSRSYICADEDIDFSDESCSDDEAGTEGITVRLVKTGEKRIWGKTHACLYCCKRQCDIRRHLFQNHGNEVEVAKVMSYANNSDARKKGLEQLQNLGDFYHNAMVIYSGEGEFIVSKRPPSDKKVSYKEYAPCVFCKGYFLGVKIWKHYTDCKFKSEDLTVDDEECRTYIIAGNLRGSRILAENACKRVEGDVEQLFGSMRNDDITFVAKHDDTISMLGLMLYEKKGAKQVDFIWAKMREIARLLIRIRDQTRPKDQSAEFLALNDVLKPDKFDDVMRGLQAECKSSVENGVPSFEVPSLVLKLGHTLRKCCYIKMGQSMKTYDEEAKNDAEKFLKMLRMNFQDHASSIALRTLNCVKRKRTKCLPLTQDIVKFQTFIKERVITLTKQLQESKIGQDYYELVKATLARLITFNKRSVEAARILVFDYVDRKRQCSHQSKDIYEMLSQTEHKLASRLELMVIPGEKGRRVPFILTTDVIDAMNLLCGREYRKKAGILQNNIFAFPMTRSRKNVTGCDALDDMATKADLAEPKAFKSTDLRSYIATVSQVLNMDENELDWLANHLGHDIRVRRNFYRLQTDHVELAKVAKILHAVDSGQAHTFADKKLNDIKIEDLDAYDNIDDEEEEECEEFPSNGEESLECQEVSVSGEEGQQHIDGIDSHELQERSFGSKNKKSKRKEQDGVNSAITIVNPGGRKKKTL